MTVAHSRRFAGPTLDDLAVLRAAVEAGSFVRAGQALGLTQSAVSRAIARLEQRIGVQLFHRSARSVSLSDEGLRYYRSVAPHVAAIEDATTEAGGATAKVRGHLRVNVDWSVGQFVLTPRLAPFLEQHPELVVDVAVRDGLGDLVREGFDVAVRHGVPEPSTLKARLLRRTRILTCASPAYLERAGVPRQPRDVARHACIHMRDRATGVPFGWELWRGDEVKKIEASGRLVVNDGGALFAACLGGLGLAQLLEVYARDAIREGRLVHVLPRWADETYPLYAYHASEGLVSAKVRAFLDFVIALTQPAREGAKPSPNHSCSCSAGAQACDLPHASGVRLSTPSSARGVEPATGIQRNFASLSRRPPGEHE